MIKIKKGLDLPISGAPRQSVEEGNTVRSVAVLGPDYPGMKPTMEVKEGDFVAKGQILFSDKKTPGVNFSAPVAGQVVDINRGAKRALKGVVIEIADGEERKFQSFTADQISGLDRQVVIDQLLQSGSWPALRTRPFSRIPNPQTTPNSIFVTAIDTNPLAADPEVVIKPRIEAFSAGLAVLARLTEGSVHVCQSADADLGDYAAAAASVQSHSFGGIHPAGLPGTHIHFIDPVSANKTVWFIGYQDVIAFGQLF